MRAGIVDYRMGNLASVSKALERAGAQAFISDEPSALAKSDLLVLPGVGNFAAGIKNLHDLGLVSLVKDWTASERAVLGICLGMQLLFEGSEEGSTPGLGILPGKVIRLPVGVKVPHMGWNSISSSLSSALFGPADGLRFYFVHSYVCVPAEPSGTSAVTSYAVEFASGIESGNITGVQFHPEKSGEVGIGFLRRLCDRLL